MKKMDKANKKIKLKKKKQVYVFKNDFIKRILRKIIWILLIYFFIRGIATSLRPDQTEEVNKAIQQFKTEFSNYKDQDAEILSFARTFVKEYLTYNTRQDSDYEKRLSPYVSDDFSKNISDLNGNAEVIHVDAYRKEFYSENQVDVFVMAKVKYSIQEISEDKTTYETVSVIEDVKLKVPIFIDKDKYVVETIPMFINDDVKAENYKQVEYSSTEITNDATKELIHESLKSFFKAYYESEQSVINYYLTKEADRTKFLGLNGRMLFKEIESFRCYQEVDQSFVVAIVKLKILDGINNTTMNQEFNVFLKKIDDKYYIYDMNTKTINLLIK